MKYYIYYQPETGNILAVTNTNDKSFGDHCIKTSNEIYEKFCSTEYKINDWAVLSSPKNNNTELVKRIQEIKEFDPDQSIKQIQKVNAAPENAFVIKQNLNKGTWSVYTTLDDNKLIYHSQTVGYAEQEKQVFVVNKNNPNILLDTLTIEFKELLTTNNYDVKLYSENVAKSVDIGLICARVDEEFVHIQEN